jgi:flagellar protein FlgJ
MDGIGSLKKEVGAMKAVYEPSSGKTIKSAEAAAEEFEALLLKQMISEMWTAIPKEDGSSSREQEMYYDMYHDSIARSISEGGGIGIKEELLSDMTKQANKVL